MQLRRERVFLGIKADPALAREIAGWQGGRRHLPVRFIRPEDLHLTLVPPWEEDDVEGTLRRLRPLGELESFTVPFEVVEPGPDSRRPWLIWARGGEGGRPEAVRDRASGLLGFDPDPRPLVAHVTLARFSKDDFGRFEREPLRLPVSWRLAAAGATLFLSHPDPGGAWYEELGTVRFHP